MYEVLPWFRCFVVVKMHKLFQVDMGVLACYVVCAVVVVIGVVVVVAAVRCLCVVVSVVVRSSSGCSED